MKRYLLFSYESYYPDGGMEDCDGAFDTAEEAIAAHELGENAHVFDLLNLAVVRQLVRGVWTVCETPLKRKRERR